METTASVHRLVFVDPYGFQAQWRVDARNAQRFEECPCFRAVE